eukprot:2091285-Karenia_brevis.AAC.1
MVMMVMAAGLRRGTAGRCLEPPRAGSLHRAGRGHCSGTTDCSFRSGHASSATSGSSSVAGCLPPSCAS